MKKKIVALCLVLALALTAIGGATLAYFTDVTEDVNNTFTIGNIDITLTETAKVTDKDGKEVTDAVKKNDYGGYSYTGLMPTYSLEKKPVVTNNGANDAYVRVFVVMNNLKEINNAIDEVYESKGYSEKEIQDVYDKVFLNWGMQYAYKVDSRMWMKDRSDTKVIDIDHASRISADYGTWDKDNMFSDGEKPDGFYYGNDTYYNNALKANERVYVFYLKLAPKETYQLFDGLTIPDDFSNSVVVKDKEGKETVIDQMAMFNGLNIGVYADAIQTIGFDTPKAAFEALEKDHPMGWWNN